MAYAAVSVLPLAQGAVIGIVIGLRVAEENVGIVFINDVIKAIVIIGGKEGRGGRRREKIGRV